MLIFILQTSDTFIHDCGILKPSFKAFKQIRNREQPLKHKGEKSIQTETITYFFLAVLKVCYFRILGGIQLLEIIQKKKVFH